MTTINKSQLLAILRYLNAPSNTYDLGTNIRADVCYDIEHTERGWETFLIERTSRFEVAVFDTETDACLHAVWNRALAKKLYPNAYQSSSAPLHSYLSASAGSAVRFQRRYDQNGRLFHRMDRAGVGRVSDRKRQNTALPCSAARPTPAMICCIG